MTAQYEAHALGLLRLAYVMLGERAAAEDVVQDAFLGLCKRWSKLKLEYVTQYVMRNGHRVRVRVSRPVLAGSPFAPPYYVSDCETDAVMSQNGTSVVCGYSSWAGSDKTAAGFVLYSTTTGQQEGAVGFFVYKGQISGQVQLYWTNSTGTVLVGAEPTATGNRICVIDGKKFTPMPGNFTSWRGYSWPPGSMGLADAAW
jgi:hypothetical protein